MHRYLFCEREERDLAERFNENYVYFVSKLLGKLGTDFVVDEVCYHLNSFVHFFFHRAILITDSRFI